jgi:hypothetical protein
MFNNAIVFVLGTDMMALGGLFNGPINIRGAWTVDRTEMDLDRGLSGPAL